MIGLTCTHEKFHSDPISAVLRQISKTSFTLGQFERPPRGIAKCGTTLHMETFTMRRIEKLLRNMLTIQLWCVRHSQLVTEAHHFVSAYL